MRPNHHFADAHHSYARAVWLWEFDPVNHAQVSLRFEGLTISASVLFVARGSSVTIHLSSDNFITATGPDSPGIDCQSNSQVIFSESTGSITVTGGAPRGGTCDSLFFLSGTYSVTAGGYNMAWALSNYWWGHMCSAISQPLAAQPMKRVNSNEYN
jgi:hypothetical protein